MKAVTIILRIWLVLISSLLDSRPGHSQNGDTTGMLTHHSILSQRANMLVSEQKYDSAIMVLDSAIRLLQADTTHFLQQRASAFNSLGYCYRHTQQFDLAIAAYKAAENNATRLLGPGHAYIQDIKTSIANSLIMRHQYPQALDLLQNAMSHLSRLPDYTQLNEYLTCLVNLGWTYYGLGDFENAYKTVERQLPLVEVKYTRNHPEYCRALSDLATLAASAGRFREADAAYLSLFEALKHLSTPDPYREVAALINYGQFCVDLGRSKEALEVILKAKSMFENDFQDTLHPWYNDCIYNLAVSYLSLQQHENALPYVLKIISLDKATYGEKDPNYAGDLDMLVTCLYSTGQVDSALSVALQTLAIKTEAVGRDHYLTGETLHHLGEIYMYKKDYIAAKIYLAEATELYKRILGENHYKYISMLNRHIRAVYFSKESEAELASLLEHASKLSRQNLFQATQFMSERELLFNSQKWSTEFHSLMEYGANSPDISPTYMFENVLLYKLFLANNIKNLRARFKHDTLNLRHLEELYASNATMASLLTVPIAQQDTSAIYRVMKEIERIEKHLANLSSSFGNTFTPMTLSDIQACLQPDEALLEFVNFPNTVSASPGGITYGALLLRKNDPQPLWIRLFLDTDVSDLISTGADRRTMIEQLYTDSTNPISLHILDQILPQLGSVSTLYYATSGLLYRVNLEALPLSDQTTLGETFTMIQLGSSRDICDLHPIQQKNSSCFLGGGIAYTLNEAPAEYISDSGDIDIAYDTDMRSLFQTDTILRGGEWGYLQGTVQEVNRVKDITHRSGLDPILSLRDHMTEERFKDLSSTPQNYSPRIIHLATHGYFFPDPSTNKGHDVDTGFHTVIPASNNPMIRSGLILAGGNYAWKHGHPYKPGMEDGILTAYEISQMDLSNTELVVLSACETGLGDIQGNEGVFGLQRAFKIAGVKNLIMSLWKVPDAATAELMIKFYSNWLEKKMTIREALHSAQKEMREEGWEVYDWAGFVLVE